MGFFIPAENAEVWLVPTISSVGAMTVVEGDAGTRLTGHVTGGVNIDFASNTVDTGTLLSAFNSQAAGTYGGGTNSLVDVLYDDESLTIWAALDRGATGYLVISLAGTANQSGASWATGDVYDVFPFEVTSRHYPDLTRDALASYDVDFVITSAPTYQGTAA